MDEAIAKLEEEYCPPLEAALVSAIVGDYDLATEEGLGTARATLDQLKESALVEETAGFDPSGTGGNTLNEAEEIGKRAESCPETLTSQSRDTDATSLSNGLSSLDLGEHAKDIGKAEDLETLDEDTKIMLLQDLFGDRVSRYSIQHTLRKCNGKWNNAMEELLNHVYFGEASDSEDGGKLASKGVDGFAEQTGRRGRKGKGKNRKFKSLDERRSSSLPVSPDNTHSATSNRWQTASEDVEFIATRSGLSAETVKSIYYEQRASVPQTINALIKMTMNETKKIVTDDARVQRNAQELGHDFPNIAPQYLAALIRLTHPSTADAHELAKALTAKAKDADSAGGIQLIPQYARLDADELFTRPQSDAKARSAASSQSPPHDHGSPAYTNYAAAKAQAFSQASAAHRRAKSDRLMGGAAAYYAQEGRNYASLSASATASSMNVLAASQSTSSSVDLHGIDVLNGVRIALERVEGWWYGLGEARVNGRVGAGERGGGYRVVVGRGTHSEGGKGKLGPAVSKALRADGWRVENEGASLVVRGRARV